MSLQAMSWALDASDAGGNDRLVLIVMCHHTDEHGFCGLSKATYADETRLSESTVMRAQQALVALGEISEAEPADAPAWWKAIPVNRRPKLYTMTGFLGSQYATPIRKRARGVTGVSLGCRGGVTGVSLGCRGGVTEVHDTPTDQPVSDVNREQNSEKRTYARDPSKKPEPDCIRCGGTGTFWSATAGADIACTDHLFVALRTEPPWVERGISMREWAALDADDSAGISDAARE